MKKIITIAAMTVVFSCHGVLAQNDEKGLQVMQKIKISFNGNEVVGEIYEGASARDFVSQLPLTISFDDYNSIEKVATLPKKLTTVGEQYSHNLLAGDIGYYAPWNNLVFYYENFNYSGSGIIKIGKMLSGVDKLKSINGKFDVKIEKID